MKNKNNLIAIICIFIVTLFTMLPMLTSEYKSSHDTKYHIASIVSITENIKNTNFPGKILPNIANNFGYGSNLFYPPLAHNSIAYINTIVDNHVISIEIFHFLILFTSGVTMYFLSKKVSDSWCIGLLSAVIYMLFPYHISNIYIRDAQGEALLFVFLPLIISGLYDLYNDNIESFYPLFIIGYVGGMLSHLTMMVYFTIIILIIMLTKFKQTIKNIRPLIVASLFILGITSFFIVPLMEQKLLGNYRVFQDGVMVQGTWGNGLNVLQYFNFFTTMKSYKVKYFIDLITLILLIITFTKYKKVNNKFYNCMLIILLVSFIISTKLFPWDIFPRSFRIFQYPWRFETFFALALALIAPLCLKLVEDQRVITFILSLLIVLFIQPILNQASEEVINVNNVEYFYGLGWQEEYLPVNTYENKQYYEEKEGITIISGTGSVNISESVVPKLKFNVEGNVTIELPRLYYVGYTLVDSNNKEISIYENDKGFIETEVSSGEYYLDYTGTTIDRVCNIVSLISIVGLGVFVLWKRK